MIPLKIQIKNFVSYGNCQTIDFEPYPLICLSGKNGHGKSALLDALTWALWGQARKVSGAAKADEGLLHLGQTHMSVTFDFYINGVEHRVRREFSLASGKSLSALEFGIFDQSTKKIHPLTDKTIRGTQEKINALLGLTYETFINSAFLRQGQAHEFSKKSPKERKDVLATILGLDHFEQMRRLALDKAKEASYQQDISLKLVEQFSAALSEKSALKSQLAQTEAMLFSLAQRENHLAVKTEELKRKIAAAAEQKAMAQKIEYEKHHNENILTDLTRQILEDASFCRRVTRQARSQRVTFIEDERAALQEELKTMQIYAAQKIELTEQYSHKQENVRNHQQRMQDEYKTALETLQTQIHSNQTACLTMQEKIDELVKKKMSLEQEINLLHHQLSIMKKESHDFSPDSLVTLNATIERRKSGYHTFISKARGLQSQLVSAEQKKRLLHSSESRLCPLCEQSVKDSSRLVNKFKLQEQLLSHQLKRLEKVTKNLKKLIDENTLLAQTLSKKAEERQALFIKIEQGEKALTTYQNELALVNQTLLACNNSMFTYRQKHAQNLDLKHRLELTFKAAFQDPSFLNLKTEIEHLARQLEKIPYNPLREKQIHERLTNLSTLAQAQSTLIKDLALVQEHKKAVHQKSALARELKEQLQLLTAKAAQLAVYKKAQADALSMENDLNELWATLKQEKESLILKKGALEAQVAALNATEISHQKELKLLATHAKVAQEYTLLSQIVSKDGIQALLIEESLPELEQEANTILSKLTDNQAHISIESLRDLKSGKIKETLDIKISDALGIRPYELFSGGEAFRIDFALRIALSKLLAKRSGTALETLIIDEGFGSQDEEGLARIVDALMCIQDDFAKIIIVSHLPTFKEQFPVHFFVRKTNEGSMVEVFEHC